MVTIALNSMTWDLEQDIYGNIKTLSDGLDVAQDVASAIKLFLGELWYDTSQGVPYYEQVLGKTYGPALMEGLFTKAALTVSGVVSAKATITGITNRRVSGSVRVIDATGQAHNVHF